MKRISLLLLVAIGVAGFVIGSGCDSPNGITPGVGNPTDPTNGNNDGNGGDEPPADSVGDVSNGGGSNGGQSSGTIRARVRNETNSQADVTLRFIRDNAVVHLAFVRAMPETITMVLSPQMSDQLDLSGLDIDGHALVAKSLMYGQDFDVNTPAEYVITKVTTPPTNGGGNPNEPGEPDPNDDPPPVDEPGEPEPNIPGPPTITLLEPASEIALSLGSTFNVRWSDTADVAGASVVVGLRRVGSAGIVPMSPAVAAGLDGINDELSIVVQGIQPGTYDVVATIDDGTATDFAIAPGRIVVDVDPENVAPTLTILSPTSLVELSVDDDLTITWNDVDPDSNATITFELVASAGSDIALGSFIVGPPVAEDPDGAMSDRLRVGLDYVLPGEYDLVGTINDGLLVGTARIQHAVRVVSDDAPVNDAPVMTFTQPGSDVIAESGSSFVVTWTDSDSNDDARISIMLDPDLFFSAPDGDEIVLVGSLSEDVDGTGDSISLGLPNNLAIGSYRVVGVITDGLIQSTVVAPGILIITDTEPSEEPEVEEPIALPSVAFIDPGLPVRARAGDMFGIRLAVAHIPYNASARFYLDNTRLPNGHERVDVTPAGFVLNPTTTSEYVSTGLTIPTDGSIPNSAWQRSFDLEVVITVGTIEYRAVSLAPIWVRQEVEIVSVEMINYWCTPQGGGSNPNETFAGLRIAWRGGGFDDGLEVLNPVRLWLSADGLIPANGQNNDTHRMISASQVEGPNQTRLTEVTVPAAFGLEYVRVGNYLVMQMALDTGSYQLVPEVTDERFGQIISTPFGDSIEACFPLPNAGFELEP